MNDIISLYFAEMSIDSGKSWNRITEFPGGKVVVTLGDCEGVIELRKTDPRYSHFFPNATYRIVRCDLPLIVEKVYE